MTFSFLHKIVKENLNLPRSSERLEELIETMKDHFEHLGESAQDVNAHSEVDAVMEEMNIMAGLSRGSEAWLQKGEQYIVSDAGKTLVIDPLLCHAIYKRYVRSVSSSSSVIESAKAFINLLKDEPYYIESTPVTGMGSGRPMARLNRDAMLAKGVDTSSFD